MTNHCCNDCKVAQELGEMPKGSTCTPCAGALNAPTPTIPTTCPAGTNLKLLPGIGWRCVGKPLTHSNSPASPPACPVGTAPLWVPDFGQWLCVAKPSAPSTPGDDVAAPSRAGVPKRCQKLPWLAREIDAKTTAAWRAGYHDIDAVALDVLAEVYPTTRAREPINWTLIGLGTVPAAVCLAELRRRVVSRVAFVFASLEEEAAEHRYQAVKGDLA